MTQYQLEIQYRLFMSIFNHQHLFDSNKTNFVENNEELPIMEIVCVIYYEQDIKFEVCLNVIIQRESTQYLLIRKNTIVEN